MATNKPPLKQGSDKRKKNATSWAPGKSGNPAGRKLGGKPTPALVRLAREFQAEAFGVVKEIARSGADEGERLRAARLALEIANTPDAEEKEQDDTLEVRLLNHWRPVSTTHGLARDQQPAPKKESA